MRIFGLGGVAGCHDILVKSARIVDGDGVGAPRASSVRPLYDVCRYKFPHRSRLMCDLISGEICELATSQL